MQACCFTGHRIIPKSETLSAMLEAELRKLIAAGVTDFYAGGALGWDTLCAETVIRLRDTDFPAIRLHLVLPCPAEEQSAKWTAAQKAIYQTILKSADSTELVSEAYSKTCMKQRNQRLVDHADCCVCYSNEKKSASGTGQTVRMAQRKTIRIINLFEKNS